MSSIVTVSISMFSEDISSGRAISMIDSAMTGSAASILSSKDLATVLLILYSKVGSLMTLRRIFLLDSADIARPVMFSKVLIPESQYALNILAVILLISADLDGPLLLLFSASESDPSALPSFAKLVLPRRFLEPMLSHP